MRGDSKSRLYRTWYAMINRCHGAKLPQQTAIHYRDRGITVCCEWRNSFDNFKEWALNSGYSEHLTIDRKNSDGNYCPENCQWLTKSENSKKANIEKERRKNEGHPNNGLWMVAEKISFGHYYGYPLYGYKVIETGLYKSEALKKVKELSKEKPWEHKYVYSPTQQYRVGDVAEPEDIKCFLRANNKATLTTH